LEVTPFFFLLFALLERRFPANLRNKPKKPDRDRDTQFDSLVMVDATMLHAESPASAAILTLVST
jgi:hypothetical protein